MSLNDQDSFGHELRILDIGTKSYTQVACLDKPGAGNACHEYQVLDVKGPGEPNTIFAKISFQNGPVKEAGVNGCHQEDLMAVVIDRLECFQAGPYCCEENEQALALMYHALWWLRRRTNKRVARGVEGTSTK